MFEENLIRSIQTVPHHVVFIDDDNVKHISISDDYLHRASASYIQRMRSILTPAQVLVDHFNSQPHQHCYPISRTIPVPCGYLLDLRAGLYDATTVYSLRFQ